MANELQIKSALDFLNNETQNNRWHERATVDPTDITTPNAAQVGRHWFRNDLERVRYHDGTVVTHVPRHDTGKTETVAAHWTFDRGASTPPFSQTATLPSVGSTATRVTNFNAHYLNGYLHDAANIGDTIGLRLSDGRMKGEDPTDADDFATKQYVDNFAQGFRVADEVRVATTANLSATYSAGVLTATGNGSINSPGIDGITTLIVGDRILVKNQSTGGHNGIYDITDLGSAGTPFILTRSSDADTAAEVTAGLAVFVNSGTANGFSAWAQTATVTTIGTDVQIWKLFNRAGSFSAGNGMVLAGSVFHFASSSNYTQGAVFYANSTTTVGQTAALNGIVQGNGTSAPTAITGTAGRITKWSATAPYLVDSIISESGQALTLNGGASSITTSTGNVTLASGGGNGSVVLTPNGTGLVLMVKATSVAGDSANDLGYSQTTTTAATSNTTHRSSPIGLWGAQIWNGAASVAKTVRAQIVGVSGTNSAYTFSLLSTDTTLMTIRGDTGATSIPGAITTLALFTGTTALFTGNVTTGGLVTGAGFRATGLTNNRWIATDTATPDFVTPTPSANAFAATNSSGTGIEYKTILGTVNQIDVSHSVGSISISLVGTPVITGLNLSSLNASRWVGTDASKNLVTPAGTANQLAAMDAAGTSREFKTISGADVDQVIVTHGVGTISLSLPQDVATSSSPTFKSLSIESTSGNTYVSARAAETGRSRFALLNGVGAPRMELTYVGTSAATYAGITAGNVGLNTGSGSFAISTGGVVRTTFNVDGTVTVVGVITNSALTGSRLMVTTAGKELASNAALTIGLVPFANGAGSLVDSIIAQSVDGGGNHTITLNGGGGTTSLTTAGTALSLVSGGGFNINLGTSGAGKISTTYLFNTAVFADGVGQLTNTGTVALSQGGTGQSLTDPGGHRLLGWDDTDNAIKFFTLGTGLSYDAATDTVSSVGTGGTVTEIIATQPAAGFTIGGSPITTSGTLLFTLSDDLAAVEALGTSGIVQRTALNTWSTIALGAANRVLGVNAAGTAAEYKDILPTTNQVNVAHAANSITLSLPQNIHTAASPTFSSMTAVGANNAVISARPGAETGYSVFQLANASSVRKLELFYVGTGAATVYQVTAGNVGINAGAASLTLGTSDLARIVISSAGVINIPGLTASRFIRTDGSSNLTVSGASTIVLTSEVSGILPLANGGTGSALSDPGGHRLLGWDDTNGDIRFFIIGTGLSYDAATDTLSSSGGAGGGTVTNVDATAPAAGFTITGAPITVSGTLVFALADDLAAVEGISTTGIVQRTASNTWSTLSIVPLSQGGTGSNLSDPGADRLVGWDNTNNDIRFFTIGAGLSYDAATDTLTASGAALVQGNGIVISGSTIHFASASNYTPGAIFYASSTTAVGQSAALSGIVQGNGTSAPSAITGTAGRLAQWSATAPYLGSSIIGISGQTITINGGASSIVNATGDLEIFVAGGNGNIILDPDGTGSVRIAYMPIASVVFTDANGDLNGGGVVSAVQGGTGQSAYVQGDLLYAGSTTTLSKLASVATGNVLHAGGIGTDPFWDKVDLVFDTTGILSLAKGGTGFNLSTPTAHKLLGWDNTSADVRFFTIGTGLSYDAATDTLSATGSVGSGTIGRLSKWSTTTALTDSIVSESGQVLTLNGGASTITTSSGNFTLTSAAGNGSILMTPHNTGIVRISRVESAFPSEVPHLSIESTSSTPVKRVDIGYDNSNDLGWLYSYQSATGTKDFAISALNTRFYQNGTEHWRFTSAGILQAAGAQTVQTASGNLTLATAAGNGSILLTTHGTGLVQVSSLAVSRFVKTDGSSNLSVSSASTIVLTSEVSGILPLANGGTGVALVDPAAHRLMGWNNVANEIRFITMGFGLAYDPTFDVLTVTAGGGAPGGSDTYIQYNNAGAFGGSAGLIWTEASYALKIGTSYTDPGSIYIGSQLFAHITGGTSAYSNAFVGPNSGNLLVTGTFNSVFGSGAAASLTSGGLNDAFGADSLNNLTTGSRNVAFGAAAGDGIVNGEYNVILGHAADASSASAINQIVIGGRGNSGAGSSSVIGQGDNTATIGGTGTASTYLNVNAGQATALRAWVGGTVFVDTDEYQNSTTSQETLNSFPMPAGTMAQAGDRVIIRASGYAVAAGTNIVNAQFGSTPVFASTSGSGTWFMFIEVIRINSTEQRSHAYGGYTGGVSSYTLLVPATEDLDTPITIAIGCVAGQAANVHLLSFSIEWHPRST